MSYEKRSDVAKASAAWIEKNPSAINEVFFQDMISALEGNPQPGSLEVPIFFREHYDPGANPAKVRLLNKYNQLVGDCPWYRELVPQATGRA